MLLQAPSRDLSGIAGAVEECSERRKRKNLRLFEGVEKVRGGKERPRRLSLRVVPVVNLTGPLNAVDLVP